ncbi:MAG: AmmeMemoRadiSam system radical SAM enzyme [Holophagaceae bacterium]|nr:AmmeMemoRadiSam system radical SAM enzyme [Holophagaceae bacterium]
MTIVARWWCQGDNSLINCTLCPQMCNLRDGDSGNCGARYAKAGKLWTRAIGVGTSPVADPIEKKPLYHFLPGTKVLSFGMVGCNLSCAFCQNWNLSNNHNHAILQPITPEECVQMALEQGCSGIAFTYNEPIISSEFCIEVSKVAHQAELKTIAVSNGYIMDEARTDLFSVISATNIDLKGINPAFYSKICGARLEPVLETLSFLVHSTTTWVEITNLLIPGLNDSVADIEGLTDWVCRNLGLDVPIHFSAFHPAFRMNSVSRTPTDTLVMAKKIAHARGLRYVYLGNVSIPQSTICHKCESEIILRNNYFVNHCNILDNACSICKTRVAGLFE